MSGLKVTFLVLCVIIYGSCEFSELVNIDSIIESANKLPDFKDQVLKGKHSKQRIEFKWIFFKKSVLHFLRFNY